MLLTNPPSRVDPVDTGHAQIHEHDVRAVLVRQRHGLGAILRHAHDLEVRNGAENHAHTFAHHVLIVADENANHAAASSTGIRARTIVPTPRPLSTMSCPPAISIRSCIPFSPKCA